MRYPIRKVRDINQIARDAGLSVERTREVIRFMVDREQKRRGVRRDTSR